MDDVGFIAAGYLIATAALGGYVATRVIVPIAVIAAALCWVAVKSLTGNLVYYKTTSEVVQHASSLFGERIRLGGYVEPCSVRTSAGSVSFLMSDGATTMTVVTSRAVPQDFRGGAGAVAEGAYGRDGTFHADDVLVKHNDAYAPVVEASSMPTACGG